MLVWEGQALDLETVDAPTSSVEGDTKRMRREFGLRARAYSPEAGRVLGVDLHLLHEVVRHRFTKVPRRMEQAGDRTRPWVPVMVARWRAPSDALGRRPFGCQRRTQGALIAQHGQRGRCGPPVLGHAAVSSLRWRHVHGHTDTVPGDQQLPVVAHARLLLGDERATRRTMGDGPGRGTNAWICCHS